MKDPHKDLLEGLLSTARRFEVWQSPFEVPAPDGESVREYAARLGIPERTGRDRLERLVQCGNVRRTVKEGYGHHPYMLVYVTLSPWEQAEAEARRLDGAPWGQIEVEAHRLDAEAGTIAP